MTSKAQRKMFMMKRLREEAPKVVPTVPVITLVWKDGGECRATVTSLAPIVMCGRHQFAQTENKTRYVEV